MKNILSASLFILTSFFVSCASPDSKSVIGQNNSALKEECLKKNFKACTLLASTYIETQKFETAKTLYKASCENGEEAACYALGERLIVEGLLIDASPYFKKACEQKFEYACRRLHFTNFQQLPLIHLSKNDFEECEKKNSKKCLSIGYVYSGTGNYSRAKAFFQKACDQGEAKSACYELAAIEYYQGGTANAKKNYQLACAKNNQDACKILEEIK